MFGKVVVSLGLLFEEVFQDVFGQEPANAAEVTRECDFANVAFDVVKAGFREIVIGKGE